MITLHNKKTKNTTQQAGVLSILGKKESGQVAVVLILLAAFGLLFFAVAMNFSSVAKEKNRTMVAAEQAASTMGSMMSSYAERLSMEYLAGGLIKCKKSNFWSAIWKIIFIVVICLIITFPMVFWAGPIAWILTAIALSSIFTIPQSIAASKILAAEAEMIKQWNQQMSKMSAEDQVLEQGISAAFRTMVNDPVTVADFLDMNMNGQYVTYNTDPNYDHLKTATNSKTGWDEITRANYFYTLRLQSLELGETHRLDEFADVLHDFIYRDDPNASGSFSVNENDFGLHDPTKEICVGGPAECDPNCVPQALSCCFVDDCSGEQECSEATPPACCSPCPDDPSCWGIESSSAGDAASCGARSFLGTDYPFVFRPFYENPTNNKPATVEDKGIVSWREFYGRDDEVRQRHVVSDSWNATIENLPQVSRVPDLNAPLYQEFFESDTTGYFSSDLRQNFLHFSDADQSSVFAFFHLVANNFPAQTPSGAQRISDNINAKYLSTDPKFLLADGACAISMGDVDHQTLPDAGWKPGADLYCDDEYPYDTECSKHGNGTTCTQIADIDGDGTMETIDRDCLCGEISGQEKYFNEDMLDAIYYQLTDLFSVAAELQTLFLSDPSQYAASFKAWYEQLANWIEEGCRIGGVLTDGDGDVSTDDCDNSPDGGLARTYTERGRDGKLREWRDYLKHYYDKIDGYENNVSSVAGECAPAAGGESPSYIPWCIPAQDDCHNAPIEESDTFDANANGTVGDIEDVVACLDWNVNDTIYDSSGGYTGNGAKFQQCYDLCLDQANADPLATGGPARQDGSSLTLQDTIDLYKICGKIPRPLVINDPTIAYEPPDGFTLAGNNVDTQVIQILECLAANSLKAIYDECDGEPWATGSPWDTVSVEAPPVPSSVGLPVGAWELLQQKVDFLTDWVVPECETGSTHVFSNVCNGNYGSLDSGGSRDDAIRCDSAEWQKDVSRCISSWINDAVAWPFIKGFMENHLGAIVDENGISIDTYPVGSGSGDVYEALQELIPGDFKYSDSCKGEGGMFNTPTEGSQKFLDFVQENITPASNQVIIFNQRVSELKAVIEKMDYSKSVLGEGYDRFTEFLDNGTAFNVGPLTTDYEGAPLDSLGSKGYVDLDRAREVDLISNKVVPVGSDMYSVYEATTVDGSSITFSTDSPAELLIKHRRDLDEKATDSLPAVLVYYWTTYDEDTQEKEAHAAKVEVRAPKRCIDRSCVETGANRFPWIRSYHTGGFFSKKICNILMDYQGRVKARVIRYDEKQKTPSFGLANKIPFVGRSLTHPDMGEVVPGGSIITYQSPETYGGACGAYADRTLGEFYALRTDDTQNNWKAIMLNYPPGQHPETMHVFNTDPAYDTCWDFIHENFLKYGMHSESCARYYWGQTGVVPRTRGVGMQIRFVPCDEAFLSGNT